MSPHERVDPVAAPGAPATEEALLTVALEAADAAAAELVARFGRRQAQIRAKSSPTDLVSEADLSAERAIREVLAARRPQDAILGEEGGETGQGALRWVVDPLDGTTNFLFGVPQWAVSVACEDADGAIAGVVLDPCRGERFTATRSGPATLDGEPFVAPDADGDAGAGAGGGGGSAGTGAGAAELSGALAATGFAYDAATRARQAQVLSRVLPAVRDIRRAGAAAIDLCWLACGRYDVYWERGVKAWDIAAGGLIVRRAGLVTETLAAGEDGPEGLIAGPAGLVAQLRALVLGA